MTIPPHLRDFWDAFAAAYGQVDEDRFYEASYFGDSEELANELATLVLQGTKRATTGTVWSAEDNRMPKPGDLSIVTDWSGRPLCVIETRTIEILPFRDVTAEFAAVEGEGDGSLSYWRKAHIEFFTRECVNAGKEFTEDMLVACERFEVVYRPTTSAA